MDPLLPEDQEHYKVTLEDLKPHIVVDEPAELFTNFFDLNTWNGKITTVSESYVFYTFPTMLGSVFTMRSLRNGLKLLNSFTFMLIVAQIVMFFIVYSESRNPFPGLKTDTSVLHRYGASSYHDIFEEAQYYRLISPILLHGDLFHLLVNVVFEWKFLMNREAGYGIIKYIVIVVLSSATGTLYSSEFSRMAYSVGASCAINGVIGSYLVLNFILAPMISRKRLYFIVFIFIVIVLWLALTPADSGIDKYGHIGGFAMGCALAPLLFVNRAESACSKAAFCVFSLIALPSCILVPFITTKNPSANTLEYIIQ